MNEIRKLMETIDAILDEEDPCWDGYEMIGMKEKDGKEVPNCVPEEVEEEYTIEDADEIYGPMISELSEAEYQGRKVELNKPTLCSLALTI